MMMMMMMIISGVENAVLKMRHMDRKCGKVGIESQVMSDSAYN